MANQKIHRYEAAGLSVDAPPTWRSTAASGQFRLKMSDAKTGADKGWLGVSTANWVQLIYGDPNQSNVAICEWIKTINQSISSCTFLLTWHPCANCKTTPKKSRFFYQKPSLKYAT